MYTTISCLYMLVYYSCLIQLYTFFIIFVSWIPSNGGLNHQSSTGQGAVQCLQLPWRQRDPRTALRCGAMERSTIFKNGKASISMGHTMAMLNNQRVSIVFLQLMTCANAYIPYIGVEHFKISTEAIRLSLRATSLPVTQWLLSGWMGSHFHSYSMLFTGKRWWTNMNQYEPFFC